MGAENRPSLYELADDLRKEVADVQRYATTDKRKYDVSYKQAILLVNQLRHRLLMLSRERKSEQNRPT